MFYLFNFFSQISATLKLYTPSSLKEISIPNVPSTFGDPGLFEVFGKIKFPKADKCFINDDLQDSFALFSTVENCNYLELSLVAQEQGAKLVIFYNSDLDTILPADRELSVKVKIPVIGIDKNRISDLNEYENERIWASYVNDFRNFDDGQDLKVTFVLSGDYNLDFLVFKKIKNCRSRIQSSNIIYKLGLSYFESNNEYIHSIETDCLEYNKKILCLETHNINTGKQKLKNSISIYKYFENSQFDDNFIEKIENFYNICQYNYSSSCIKDLLGIELEENKDFSDLPLFNSVRDAFIDINKNPFYWTDDFCDAIFLKSFKVYPDYSICAENCTNKLLNNKKCDSECNSTECGLDHLDCAFTSGCLEFLIGDGICDDSCFNDTDCPICSKGCFLEDLKNGLCDEKCNESCFSMYCDKDVWCSPGCSFMDMKDGNCSQFCSESCFEQFCDLSVWCSPGCSYADINFNESCAEVCKSVNKQCSDDCYYLDWYQGNCDKKCSKSCLEKCDEIFCSGGCLYLHMDQGYCPSSCSSDCFKYCDNSTYCSPGCEYSDFQQGFYSHDCSKECKNWFKSGCFEKYEIMSDQCIIDSEKTKSYSSSNKSKTKLSVLQIILLSVFGFISLTFIFSISYYIFTRLKNRSNNSPAPPNQQERVLIEQNEKRRFLPTSENLLVNDLDEGEKPTCSICLGEISEKDAVALPCIHVFHQECINEWFNSARDHQICPNCRINLNEISIYLK